MRIPSFILRKLYVQGSLRREGAGFAFRLNNSLATASLTALKSLRADGREVDPAAVRVRLSEREVDPASVSPEAPMVFPRNAEVEVRAHAALQGPSAKVRLVVQSAEFGELAIEFEDRVA